MTEKVTVDPRVALVEQQLLAQAIEAHLKNRNLFLAQRVFELENPPTMTPAKTAKGDK
jgi:hypothetical protein